jgi:peptide/nickel transport system permease protein
MAERTAILKKIPSAEEIIGPTPGQILRRKIFGHRGLIIGGGILLGILLIALLAPLLSPHDPYAQTLGKRLLPPIWQPKGTWTHILGTDPLGRDYLSRLLYGAQISLLIGLAAAFISGFIGTALGLTAGYFGGRVDLAITYIITVRLSIPVILVALATVQLVGGSLNVVILVLGLLLWDRFAVVIRSSTMQIRAMDYVKSAQAVGCSLFSILCREVLPNVFNQLVVIATLEMAQAILLEAALSFLGVGVQPPTPSWGLMINEGKNFMFFKPYLVMIPGVALFLLVLSINLLGDGVRDVTAPESRS